MQPESRIKLQTRRAAGSSHEKDCQMTEGVGGGRGREEGGN